MRSRSSAGVWRTSFGTWTCPHPQSRRLHRLDPLRLWYGAYAYTWLSGLKKTVSPDLPPARPRLIGNTPRPQCRRHSELVSWGQMVGVLSSSGLIHPSFRCSLQINHQEKEGSRQEGQRETSRNLFPPLPSQVARCWPWRLPPAPQQRTWLLARSPPGHHPRAHFLLFLLPAPTHPPPTPQPPVASQPNSSSQEEQDGAEF